LASALPSQRRYFSADLARISAKRGERYVSSLAKLEREGNSLPIVEYVLRIYRTLDAHKTFKIFAVVGSQEVCLRVVDEVLVATVRSVFRHHCVKIC